MCRRVRAPSARVVTGDGASQRVLLGCHPPRCRHARDVVAPFSRQGRSRPAIASVSHFLSLRHARKSGLSEPVIAARLCRWSLWSSRLQWRRRRVDRLPCARRRVETVHRPLPVRHYRSTIVGTSMDQRWRVRRTLYEGKWATAAQSGISAPRFVRYPGPNFSTVATHHFRSTVRASVASLASWRAFGNAASFRPNLTVATRSARKSLLASSSFRLPARTRSAVAFLGHRISHQRDA